MKLRGDSGWLLVIVFALCAFAGIIMSTYALLRYAVQEKNRELDRRISDSCVQAGHAAQRSAHEPEVLQQHLEFIRLSSKLEKLIVFDAGRNSLGDANPRVRPGKRYTYIELPPEVSETVLAGGNYSNPRREVETFAEEDVVFRGVAIPVRVSEDVVGGVFAQAGVDFEDELRQLQGNLLTAFSLAAAASVVIIAGFVFLYRRNEAMRELMQRQSRMAMIHQLSAGIAHDIKNPLTVIMNSAELIKVEEEEGLQMLGLIRDASNQVLNITEQLLGTGRMNEPVELELKAFVEDACRPFLPAARGRGVAIKYDLKDGGLVRASPTPLRMCISNIVNNAVQALDEGGKVHLSFRRDGTHIGIAISDNGPGIPVSMRAKIFDPMITSKKDGSGLGLPVARQLVEDQHGRIELESEEGVGTTFTIWLPELRGDDG